MNKKEIQKLYFYDAFKEFILLYAHNNIGSNIEVNIEEIAKYLDSDRFLFQICIDNPSKEEIFSILEDDLLNGMPIWKFLKLTEFQYTHLKEEFEELAKLERKRAEEKFKCYSCIFFDESETDIGYFLRCHTSIHIGAKRYSRKNRERRGGSDLPVEECDDYTNKYNIRRRLV